MVERDHGRVRADSFHLKKVNKKNLNALVRDNVDIKNAVLVTDG